MDQSAEAVAPVHGGGRTCRDWALERRPLRRCQVQGAVGSVAVVVAAEPPKNPFQVSARDEIDRAITERLATAGYLKGEKIAPLAIVSAEELFFCEGFMERGESFLALISGWKSDPASAPHSFKNYLIEHGGGRAPGSEHFEQRFAEASAEQAKRLFGKDYSAAKVLARTRDGGSDAAEQ